MGEDRAARILPEHHARANALHAARARSYQRRDACVRDARGRPPGEEAAPGEVGRRLAPRTDYWATGVTTMRTEVTSQLARSLGVRLPGASSNVVQAPSPDSGPLIQFHVFQPEPACISEA